MSHQPDTTDFHAVYGHTDDDYAEAILYAQDAAAEAMPEEDPYAIPEWEAAFGRTAEQEAAIIAYELSIAPKVACRSRSDKHCEHGVLVHESSYAEYDDGPAEDNTYDEAGTVICDACYVAIGMPLMGTPAFITGKA